MVAFHRTLSERSVQFRYFGALKLAERISHERLVRVCHADFINEVALVVEPGAVPAGSGPILGVGRLSHEPGSDTAELAAIVSDAWQGRGLGSLLVRNLLDRARAAGWRRIVASILSDNHGMVQLCRRHGFQLHREKGGNDWIATLSLEPKTGSCPP
jgi:acetyltransferase